MNITLRHPTFPAASLARIVMVLEPTSSATGPAVHWVVPLADPVFPSESVQVTDTTPTLSLAVPLSVAVLAVVLTLVVGGDRMVSVGATVSFGEEVGAGAGDGAV